MSAPLRRLLRLTAVTPVHCGSAEGEAALARPTQKDTVHELPYVPGSALKGVLAGRHGDQVDDGSNGDRESVWGSPDRPGAEGTAPRRGRPSRIVIGNAELLAFPLPTTGGRPAWVVPAGAAARALAWLDAGHGATAEPGVFRLLRQLEAEASSRKVLCLGGDPPPAAGGPPLRPLTGAPAEWPATLTAALGRLFAGAPPSPWLIAGESLAGLVWPAATELRTLTAVDGPRRVVRPATLRNVELIPAGSVFVSRVSELDGERLEAGRLQAGAWESQGLGWLRGELATPAEPAPAAAAPAGAAPSGGAPRPRGAALATVMRDALAAVRALAAEAGSADESTGGDGTDSLNAARRLRIAGRAAVYNFGPRARLYGLGAAVAFALARSKPLATGVGFEARGQRWLLGALLDLAPDLHRETGRCRPLAEWLDGRPYAGSSLPDDRELLMSRWLWLRRYAEAELGEPVPGGEGER